MKQVRSYDLETGKIVWFGAGTTMNPIPSPVAADGLVILTAGFRGNNLKAVRLADAKDDITNTPALVWTLDRDTPYVPSPLLYDGILYMLKSNNGILSVFDAQDRETPLPADPPRSGAEHLRLPGRRRGPSLFPEPGRNDSRPEARPDVRGLAQNKLDDGFNASPALVDNELYLRGYKNLYCISEK